MQVRTCLATCKTTIWTDLSHHSIIGWDQGTPYEDKLFSVSLKFFSNIFSQSSSLLFSKPRRRKKRFKEEVVAEKQEVFIIILIN
jgi:hypothetical protein